MASVGEEQHAQCAFLSDFAQQSSQFDPTTLKSIRLVFDRIPQGTVVVDDIGVSSKAGPFTKLGEP